MLKIDRLQLPSAGLVIEEDEKEYHQNEVAPSINDCMITFLSGSRDISDVGRS